MQTGKKHRNNIPRSPVTVSGSVSNGNVVICMLDSCVVNWPTGRPDDFGGGCDPLLLYPRRERTSERCPPHFIFENHIWRTLNSATWFDWYNLGLTRITHRVGLVSQKGAYSAQSGPCWESVLTSLRTPTVSNDSVFCLYGKTRVSQIIFVLNVRSRSFEVVSDFLKLFRNGVVFEFFVRDEKYSLQIYLQVSFESFFCN